MRATEGQVSEQAVLPPGLLVVATPAVIAEAFADLCALQPVRMEPEGLVCAPRSAPELARPALARCPLPVQPIDRVPGWPDPPAAMLAGWYRHSPAHLAAPEGVRELVQAPGEGFGPGDHATTAMCLALLEEVPAGPAVDVGCGSGLLAQAWVALGRGDVLACDLDPRALAQADRSLRAAGREGAVTLRRGPAAGLSPGVLAGRVLLVNAPLPAHTSLLARIVDPPRAVVLSGLRPARVAEVADGYRALGLQTLRREESGGFVALAMALPDAG